MQSLLSLTRYIDAAVAVVARTAAWLSVILVLTVCYDVLSRYFGVPKPFDLNSTMIQESEYWMHTFLFALVMGYAYTQQAHVRIDLIRDRLPLRVKYIIEIAGCLFFLLTYVAIATVYTFFYVHESYLEHEVSKSVIGLTNIWLLKSALPIMFIMIGLAGVSQLIKAIAGLLGMLPRDKIAETLGGDI